MLRAMSTHVRVRERLQINHLEAMVHGGAQAIELFCQKEHFDYTDRARVREIAAWFREHPGMLHSMHSPIYPSNDFRSGAPALNIVDADKRNRIDAMDEIKRALEVAEQIPFRFLIVHLGEREDTWSPRSLENSLTALEHLRAFANPLGVKLLVENLQNEVTRPANILEILNVGHFSDIGVCLDVGHAHLGDGVDTVFKELRSHIRSSHLHDNKGGFADLHLPLGTGNINLPHVVRALKRCGYDGTITLEVFTEDRHYLAYSREVLRRTWDETVV